jgi:hypothetical protein
MRTVFIALMIGYTPIVFSSNLENIKTKSIKPAPISQAEDREGESDPGILKDAKKGDAAAQFAYGMIQYGQGHYKIASIWYLKAANQNHLRAQYELGKMYMKGQGVPVNYQRAYFLFTLGEDQGYADSAKQKVSLVKKMSPSQINEAKTMVKIWYAKKNK